MMLPADRLSNLVLKVAGSQFPIGRDLIDGDAVIVKLEHAASGLPQKEQLEAMAFGVQGYRLAAHRGRDADAAEPVHAVAAASQQAVRVPAAGFTASEIQPPIAEERPAGERV